MQQITHPTDHQDVTRMTTEEAQEVTRLHAVRQMEVAQSSLDVRELASAIGASDVEIALLLNEVRRKKGNHNPQPVNRAIQRVPNFAWFALVALAFFWIGIGATMMFSFRSVPVASTTSEAAFAPTAIADIPPVPPMPEQALDSGIAESVAESLSAAAEQMRAEAEAQRAETEKLRAETRAKRGN